MNWTHVYPNATVHDMKVNNLAYRPSWTPGKPIIVLNHFTAVCGSALPGAGRFDTEGIGSPFGITRGGTVYQYTDLERSTWHARDCSHYAVGIEFDALPPGCPILPVQLEAGAELNAWLCHTFKIPAQRSPGIAYKPGIKAHTDGLEDGGAKWDSGGHWDSPWKATGDPISAWCSAPQRTALDTSVWTSARFVERVKEILAPPGGDDMTYEEWSTQFCAAIGVQSVSALKTIVDSAKGMRDGLAGKTIQTGQGATYKPGNDAGLKIRNLP